MVPMAGVTMPPVSDDTPSRWQTKGLIMVPRQRNTRRFTDPLRPCGPSLGPPQRPDLRLPEIVTLRRGDAAAKAVIGLLTITRRRTNTGSRLCRSACVVIVLR